jgi:hypothetical protein
MILLKAGAGAKKMPACAGRLKDENNLFFMLVFLARFHAFLYVVDGRINGLDSRHTMSALIVLGFLQMMLGLLQGFQSSLHVRLIVIVITCNSGNGDTQETENNR